MANISHVSTRLTKKTKMTENKCFYSDQFGQSLTAIKDNL